VTREARRLEVHGVVQGVGYRPFVWRLARELEVTGRVRNEGGVVVIHAEGDPIPLDLFVAALRDQAPSLARVETVVYAPTTPEELTDFVVEVSADVAGDRLVPPDAATCLGCLAELFDPADRRHRYPFVNCTQCGPRFTIIEALPYDRERTSMRAFPMCADCRGEYEDPADRRFHAEPIACPACGPRVVLVDADGGMRSEPSTEDPAAPVVEAAAMLRAGVIVALKGLGGFHLACDATSEDAVALLRARKRRPDKPFAVMVAEADALSSWFDPSKAELDALTSWRAPIVLVADRGRLAPSVAPGHRRQGAMLPATPLHHLLLREAGIPLVMTSGNASDEPICTDDDEAFDRLGGTADAFLIHNRRIVARYDDSVVIVRTGDDEPTTVRRARSFAPDPIALAMDLPFPVLGTGALLHGAFCLGSGRRAFLSQHVGDLDTEEAMAAYTEAYDRARAILELEPEVVAHDLHPDLPTTRFAESTGLPTVAVQHHHAHVAATMAEHGLDGEVLGVAFDGLGFGDDGTIWGGELLVCTPARADRIGHLRRVPQPGGDAATRHPWRMAVSHADDAGVLDDALRLLRQPDAETEVVLGQVRSGLGTPRTSSAGRLFDAVAALTGVCAHASHDGQAAMLLEQASVPGATSAHAQITEEHGIFEIDTRDLIAATVEQLVAGTPPGEVAWGFHVSLAEAVARACVHVRHHREGLDRVVLGGGVFQNDLFTTELTTRLTDLGFRVFLPREVPVGDGGIALGQVYVAAARGVS
jgi:hydrogenase maturation protein HypF